MPWRQRHPVSKQPVWPCVLRVADVPSTEEGGGSGGPIPDGPGPAKGGAGNAVPPHTEPWSTDNGWVWLSLPSLAIQLIHVLTSGNDALECHHSTRISHSAALDGIMFRPKCVNFLKGLITV